MRQKLNRVLNFRAFDAKLPHESLRRYSAEPWRLLYEKSRDRLRRNLISQLSTTRETTFVSLPNSRL